MLHGICFGRNAYSNLFFEWEFHQRSDRSHTWGGIISKRIPKVSHFKIFGSVAYVPKENRSKSNATSIKLLFDGYFDQAKAYRLLDPRTNYIVVCSDVRTMKNQILIKMMICWFDTKKPDLNQDDHLLVWHWKIHLSTRRTSARCSTNILWQCESCMGGRRWQECF